MNGRTTVLILFFWAVLTIVTPMLVRMSASAAKPMLHFNGEEKTERYKAGLQRLLTRKALVAAAATPPSPPPLPLAPVPEPSPKIEPRFAIKKLVER